jgi:hypothetical protein
MMYRIKKQHANSKSCTYDSKFEVQEVSMARSPEGDGGGGGAGARHNINGSTGWRGARILGASAERGVGGSCSVPRLHAAPASMDLFLLNSSWSRRCQTATILLLKFLFNQRRENLEV